jgi:hypothetical protein
MTGLTNRDDISHRDTFVGVKTEKGDFGCVGLHTVFSFGVEGEQGYCHTVLGGRIQDNYVPTSQEALFLVFILHQAADMIKEEYIDRRFA